MIKKTILRLFIFGVTLTALEYSYAAGTRKLCDCSITYRVRPCNMPAYAILDYCKDSTKLEHKYKQEWFDEAQTRTAESRCQSMCDKLYTEEIEPYIQKTYCAQRAGQWFVHRRTAKYDGKKLYVGIEGAKDGDLYQGYQCPGSQTQTTTTLAQNPFIPTTTLEAPQQPEVPPSRPGRPERDANACDMSAKHGRPGFCYWKRSACLEGAINCSGGKGECSKIGKKWKCNKD